MHLTHSKAVLAAIVALSTCAGATPVAESRHTPERQVAVVAAVAAVEVDATRIPAETLE